MEANPGSRSVGAAVRKSRIVGNRTARLTVPRFSVHINGMGNHQNSEPARI